MLDNPPPQQTKYWSKAVKAFLASLVNSVKVDIYNSSLDNIEAIQKAHFSHGNSKKLRNNFRSFASAWALESKFSGARRGEEAGGKQ
jgi:hypothetical protein